METPNPYESPETLPDRVVYAPPPYDGMSGPRSTAMATTSLTMGILSYAAMVGGCLCAPAWLAAFSMALTAVICGHVARGRVRQGIDEGAGMALGGLICGYVALALPFLFCAGLSLRWGLNS